MNTPSHLIFQLAFRKYANKKYKFSIPKSFIWGAIAPDIILFILVFTYIPLSLYVFGNDISYTFSHMFDDLYFNHPLWIFGYNLLHSPTLLLIFLLLSVILTRYITPAHSKILFWFFIGCLAHTAFDIPLHHDDGPRIFYPFSSYVFSSPVSYWDPQHYGHIVGSIELTVDLLLLIYLFSPKLCTFKNKLTNYKKLEK